MYLRTLIIIITNIYFLVSYVNANEVLITYEIIDYSIPYSLTNIEGDIKNGREIVLSRQGNCIACHRIPKEDDIFQGDIGPSLAGIGNRYTIAELRLRLVNPYVLNPDTIMPAFYKVRGLKRVEKKYREKSILSAQEIEDVISWLATIKD
jgi:sulfur-oxidizing protein SoxX